ncbi:hypothetical protein QBC34DRAFT_417962 [Podospora aff. communis PSN243]|uniref:Calcineurin-like phosphoesterase domain-containing protein n=1 Tax=Podospora aff. communis PSN243 TaxID=3040156 RepID=A0AAV9G2G1_9PEZI|nr:hypothetical protein QBC34DRAFT_417962 [Podospora aff. communis PSN243]
MSQTSPTAILRNGLRVLFPVSLALTLYLYLFPVFSSCAFPLPPTNNASTADTGRAAFLETAKLHWPFPASAKNESSPPTVSRPPAPFRLLALGDPQLEGDTSLPITYLGVFPHAKSLARHATFQTEHESLRHRIRQCLHDIIDIFFEDTFHLLESARKRIDLLGNDFYLAHIYRTVHWWTRPTHVSVLGDLVGSQWLDDAEFYRRADRFWSRVFRGAERVPDDLALYPDDEYDLSGYLSPNPHNTTTTSWSRTLINVAGNHDIGYAGDINQDRTARFEKAFGKVNYELRFELPLSNASLAPTIFDTDTNPSSTHLVPELRVVVLNDMNLDTPAAAPALQDATYAFVNKVINTAAAVEFKGHFTLILTHIPLYKPAGVCVDAPLFEFHDHDGTLREQNQLSMAASKGFLEGILGISGDSSAPAGGKGRQGVILNGHDHEGCDTYHYINQSLGLLEGREWEVARWRQARKKGLLGREELPGVREITVRSMMGDFGGNAGLLSLWFDEGSWEWKMEYATCPLGRQHFWWAVHILDLVVVVGVVLAAAAWVLGVVGVDVDAVIRGVIGLVLRSKASGGGVKGEVKGFKVDSPS